VGGKSVCVLLRVVDHNCCATHSVIEATARPRSGPDGAAYIQTLSCGIERVTDVDKDQPTSKLVYTFPGSFCGMPTIVGHYLVQSVLLMQGLIALDISNGNKPVEVFRLKLNDDFFPLDGMGREDWKSCTVSVNGMM
jgi:hypothetical protein